MSAVGASSVRLGDMLVAAELITPTQLEQALVAQRESGLRLGKQLVELGHVSEVQVTQALSNQLSVPWVSIARIEFSSALLLRVPGDIADRYCVMPIYVRSVRGQGDTLYIAMDDPTDAEAIQAVGRAAGLPVRPMVAPPSDIRAAIERRYFGAGESSHPARRGSSRPAVQSDDKPIELARKVTAKAGERVPTGTRPKPPAAGAPPPPVPAASKRGAGEVPLDEYMVRSEPPQKPQVERKLTFLDGTTLALPKAVRASNAGAEIREVRHVAKSLIAAQKTGAAGGPPRWDEVVQVLIDVMRDRGVSITRREFAEAWLRRRGG